MRDAVVGAAYRGFGAALMQTPLAPSMCAAVVGAVSCGLSAALMQTPIAPSMRFAVVGAASCKLGATLMLTPLAHHFSINFRRVKLACSTLFTNRGILCCASRFDPDDYGGGRASGT
jgi:hypothetical protein